MMHPTPHAHHAPAQLPYAAPSDLAAQERQRFYALLYGDAEGFAHVAAGLPATDILARGWPLADDERPKEQDKLDNTMVMLLWTRETGDAFKAAGRPHTGKVFAWPRDAARLDRYVAQLSKEYDNVYVRKYIAATEPGAKRGDPPALAQVVQVEDAPADPGALAPAYSFAVQTSAQKQQAYYRLARPLPWATVRALAEGAGLRLKPLGADSGGPNPAQFCRVPTSRNTKGHAGRYRVRLVAGAGDVLPATLARAVGVDLARPSSTGDTGATRAQREPGDLAGDAVREPWRSRATRDALDTLAAAWRPLVRSGRNGLLSEHGAPRPFKGQALTNWSGNGSGDESGDIFNLYKSVLYYGYTDGQALALAEHWAHTFRPAYAAKHGAVGVWLDLCRVHFKVCAELGDKRRIRAAQPPADVVPLPGPELARARRGRPVGVKNATRLAEALAQREGELVTRGQLATLLGLQIRMIAYLLAGLVASGQAELTRAGRGLRVARCAIKSHGQDVQSGATATPEYRIVTPNADEPSLQGEHTRLVALPCPAPAELATPAAEAAPPTPGRVCSPLPAPTLDPTLDLPLDPTLDPAPRTPLERLALVARIDDACNLIRARAYETRDETTGAVAVVVPRATRLAVAALLPDVSTAVFAAAWAYRGSWRHDADRLAVSAPPELYAELRTLRTALALADRPAPLAWADLDAETRQRLTDAQLVRAEGHAGRAEARAELAQRGAVAKHGKAAQRRAHTARIERQIVDELRTRGLDLNPPTGKASVGKRGAAPSRADADAAQQSACWEAFDRLAPRPARAAHPARPAVAIVRPQPAPAPATDPYIVGFVPTMVARLRARLANQSQVANCAD